MLAQVIIHDQNILSLLHPLLTDRTSRVRSDVLQRCKVTRRRNHDGRIGHGTIFFQSLYNIGNGRCLLADCHINTFYVLTLLVNDRINRDCRLSCLTVTDNQLTLSSADRHHGINCLNTCLQRCVNALSGNNAARHTLNSAVCGRLNGSLAVYGLSERIDNTSQHGIANGNLNHSSGRLDSIAFTDIFCTAQKYHADVILFQIQHHAVYIPGELKKLALHGIFQTMYTRNSIRHLDDSTYICHFQRRRIALNLILDN